MNIGDMVRNTRHPNAGIGIVIKVDQSETWNLSASGPTTINFAIAVFPDLTDSEQIIYPDEVEIINESR
jgi:hypothetical protein